VLPRSRRRQPRPRVAKWEYGVLLQSKILCVWNESDKKVDSIDEAAGDNANENLIIVYRKLGGTKSAKSVSIADVLNLLGSKGWELVTIQETSNSASYIFKRPGQ